MFKAAKQWLVLALIHSVAGRMLVQVSEDIENCAHPDKDAAIFDYSEFEMVALTDDDLFANGTVSFRREIKSPWSIHAFSERMERGKWGIYAFDKTFEDACNVINDPTSPCYYYTKDLQKCPIKAGDQWNFNMKKVNTEPVRMFPPTYAGKWRFTINGTFTFDGKQMNECGRFYADMIVETVVGFG